MNTKELAVFITEEINSLLRKGTIGKFTGNIHNSIHQLESGETKNLFLSIVELLTKQAEAQTFITDLSNGKVSSAPPKGNILISPFKQLHASLLHLTWQVQRLSEGDLNQQFDFHGDLSIYFNKLIQSLKEKNEIENELKNSAEKYRISIENANIGIMTVSTTGRIQTTNKECVNIFGYTQSELESMTVNEIAVSEDQMVSPNYMNSAIKNKKEAKAEFIKRYNHKSGEKITCQVSSSLMYGDNGEPLFFISHIKDITRKIEAEQELKELNIKLFETVEELKQANAAKDKFFRIIAHDLKNPFNAILGFSRLLVENVHTDSPQDIEDQALAINKSSLNAYRLLENLLEWSMSQTGGIVFNPKPVNIENLLKEVVRLTESHTETNGITVSWHINGSSLVHADANMLSTILRNLIGNAIKFTDDLGKIKITVVQNINNTLFTVSDTGAGITPEFIEKLFILEEKVTTPGKNAQKGTGLGLLLCKEFVGKHGGKIWVESEPGKGSDFKFTIPAKA